jgi:hypothetical protein
VLTTAHNTHLHTLPHSFIGPPFILWWNEMAKNPAADPGPLLAAQFKAWLTPTGWPTTYVLPTGPVRKSAGAVALLLVC